MLALLLLAVVLGSYYLLTQPVMTLDGGLVWDAAQYHQMVVQAEAGQQLAAEKPFVYRIGLPLLVGWTSKAFNADPQAIIKGYHFVCGVLSYFVFVLLLMRLISHRGVVYFLALVYLTSWNVPFRLGGIYPFNVDSPAILASTLILYLNLRWERLTLTRVLLLCAIAILGVGVREFVLAPLLAAVLAREVKLFPPGRWLAIGDRGQLLLGMLPLLCGVLMFVLVPTLVVPTGDYTFASHALISLRSFLNYRTKLLVAAVDCYGPVLIAGLMLVNLRTLRLWLDQPMLLAFCLGIVLLAVIGGTHTERFLYWGAPGFLGLLGIALQQAFPRNPRALVVLLLLLLPLQLLASRAWLPVPDFVSEEVASRPEYYLFAPYGEDAHCFHAWAHFMPRETRMILLLQYGALAGVCLAVRIWVAVRGKDSLDDGSESPVTA